MAAVGSDLDSTLERLRHCGHQIWLTAQRVLDAETPVFFDLGFSKQIHCGHFKNLLASSEYIVEYHYLDIPIGIRRECVKERNKGVSDTFDSMESFSEKLEEDELNGATIVRE